MEPAIYEKTVLINSRDVDGRGACKPSALLGYLQDASAEHTEVAGCGRKTLVVKYNVFWMLTRVTVHLDRPICWLDQLTVRTCHRGGKGIMMYRDSEFIVNGESVGWSCALWVLPNRETKEMLNTMKVRIPELDEGGNLPIHLKRLPALHAPENLELFEDRLMRYSDTDVNGHVNNIRYADFCCDVMKRESDKKHFVSDFSITYHDECMIGEYIAISGICENDCFFIHGAGKDDNTVRFDATFRMTEFGD